MKIQLFQIIISGFFLLFTLGIFFAFWKLLKGTKREEALPKFFADFGSMKSFIETLGNEQRLIAQKLEDAQETLLTLRTEYETKREYDRQASISLKRIEEVIAGTKTKGMAGENILRQTLSLFPAEMVVKSVKIKGKEVEFGLVLADKKLVPIDSKWAASEIMDSLAKEENENERKRLLSRLESEVNRRVAEATQYIDPAVTIPWAVCAVPDSVFSLCQDAHLEAFKKNVILISYSFAIPYLLTLFKLHWQYSANVDLANLGHYLMDVKRNLDAMDEILENKMLRGLMMLKNAAEEYRQHLSGIRTAFSALERFKIKSEK